MLRRVNAGLYEEEQGADVELVVKATNNNGVQAAQFDYDSTVLPQQTIQGFPGGRFLVKPGIRQFRVLVVFDPAASANARYDLFQANAAGTLTAVGKSVTNTGGTPLIGFGIDGLAVEAVVGAGRRKRPKPARRTRHKTMLTRRKSAPRSATESRQTTSKTTKRKATKRKSSKRKAARPKGKARGARGRKGPKIFTKKKS